MNIADIQDAKLMGKAKYAIWKKEFIKTWQEPNIELMKAEFWNQLSPMVKEQLRQRVPEAVANMEKRYG